MENYLDHYCERVEWGLWGEPFNAISNIGFFIAAFLFFRSYQKQLLAGSVRKLDIELLIILMLAIGLGSALWHSYATSLFLWSDRIPILLFINLYLLSCLFRLMHFSVRMGVAIFLIYHVINTSVLLTLPLETFNRSLFYLPTWAFLAVMTVVMWRKQATNKINFIITLAFFSIAIIFRSIDIEICQLAPMGTHFIWHILVSASLYYSMQALLLRKSFH